MRYALGCLILWLVRPALCRHLTVAFDSLDGRRCERLQPDQVARWGEGS